MGKKRKKSTYPHPKDKPHYKGLTLKEQKWVDHYAKTGNQTEAARVAYDTAKDPSLKRIGFEVSNREDVRKALMIELEKQEVTLDKTSRVLSEALHATKKEKDYIDGTIEEVPDHSTRLNATKEVHKIMDVYPTKKHENTNKNVNFNVYTQMSTQELKRGLEELSERLESLKGEEIEENEPKPQEEQDQEQ